MRTLYKWFWYKLGWLDKTDKVIKIFSWRKCLIDTLSGNRVKVKFVMPWEVKI